LAAVGALVVTAACSADEQPDTAPSTSAAPAGPTLLTFEVYGPPQVVTAYSKIAADFSAENPETVVNVRPYDTHALAKEAFQRQLAEGDPPDAFLAGLQDVPGLVEAEAVRSLEELLGEREVDFGDGFQRDSLEAFSSDNALQCMPVDVSPLVVYYNTALVDLNVPTDAGTRLITADKGWTLDEFATVARRATGSGVRGVYVAPDLEQVAPFIWSGGGPVVDDTEEPTSLTLADDASTSALGKLLEVVRNPQITFNTNQLERRSALRRFKTGSLAMMLGFRDLTPQLRAQENLSFDVLPLPRIGARATTGRSSGLCLSSASDHPDKTADFLAYAVSDEAMALLASTGHVVPTNLDVVNSDAFLQAAEDPASAAVFPGAVRSIRSLPSVETWDAVASSTARLLEGLFYDPVIDPLEDRLKAIDASSAPLFTPVPTQTPSPSSSPSPSATAN
jgi:multiple sugar transport system substrate-binding protein